MQTETSKVMAFKLFDALHCFNLYHFELIFDTQC